MMESNNNINLTTIDEVISEFFVRTDIEDSRDELIFRNFVYRALRWIGPHSFSIKTECIDVCDLSVKKPCDYWFGIDMNLIGAEGGVYYYQYKENGFMESEIGSCDDRCSNIEVGEDHYCFNLSSNGSRVEKVELKYYAMPMDKDGFPLIREEMVEAILAYLNWMYLERERNKHRGTRRYPFQEVESARIRWHNYLSMTKGNLKMPSPQAAEVIIRKWVTLIPDFKNKRRNSKNRTFKDRH